MKNLIIGITIVVLAGLPALSPASTVEESYSNMWGAIDMCRQISTTQSGVLGQKALLGSELIGRSVYNRDDDKIGSVKDVVIGENDQENYLIVENNGAKASSARLVLIPVSKVSRSFESDSKLKINLSNEKIAQAPKFANDDRPNFMDRDYLMTEARSYFGSSLSSINSCKPAEKMESRKSNIKGAPQESKYGYPIRW